MLQKRLAEIRTLCVEDLDLVVGAASEPTQGISYDVNWYIDSNGQAHSYTAPGDSYSDS